MARVVRDFALTPFQKRSVSGLTAELTPLRHREGQLQKEAEKQRSMLAQLEKELDAVKAEQKRLDREWVRLVLAEHGVTLPDTLPEDLRATIDTERKHLTITAPEELRESIYPSSVAPAQPESAGEGKGEAPPA